MNIRQQDTPFTSDIARLKNVPAPQLSEIRVTQGQLEAIAVRCRVELKNLLPKAVAEIQVSLEKNYLIVQFGHILALSHRGMTLFQSYSSGPTPSDGCKLVCAEHNAFNSPQAAESDHRMYLYDLEELAERIQPEIAIHLRHILPWIITGTRTSIENDSIVCSFKLSSPMDIVHSFTSYS